MRLVDRFKILRDGGVIDRETHEHLQRILMRLEDYWQLPINDQNGAGLMTYIALMLMRFKRNEVTAPMSLAIFEELKRDEVVYNEAVRIVDDIEDVLKTSIPESERQYLIANLHTILNPDVYSGV